MPRFRSRPFEIEAIQWFPPGDRRWPGPINRLEIYTAAERHPSSIPAGAFIAAYILTRHGQAAVEPGDWLIREPDGSGWYPCKPDVFEAKYEPIGDSHANCA